MLSRRAGDLEGDDGGPNGADLADRSTEQHR
jgi:hypothetical protein